MDKEQEAISNANNETAMSNANKEKAGYRQPSTANRDCEKCEYYRQPWTCIGREHYDHLESRKMDDKGDYINGTFVPLYNPAGCPLLSKPSTANRKDDIEEDKIALSNAVGLGLMTPEEKAEELKKIESEPPEQTQTLMVKGTEHPEERIPLYKPPEQTDKTREAVAEYIWSFTWEKSSFGGATFAGSSQVFREECYKHADQILSLISPPMEASEEDSLKVLVDGEWLEASDEFKAAVKSIEEGLKRKPEPQ